jgi:transcriptional regulator with XRE-family HTH domain
MKEPQKLVETEGLDLATFGQRLRHARRARGLTLAELGARVGRTPSVLSLIENGRREPRLSLIEQLAAVLSVPVAELLKKQPPSRRAQLEIALEHAQRIPPTGPRPARAARRHPGALRVLEHLVALAAELRAQRAKPTATPEEARAANAALRGRCASAATTSMTSSAAASAAARAGGLRGRRALPGHAALGGRQPRLRRPVRPGPAALGRSLTDLRNRRIYVKQEPVGAHSPRAVVLQALGHFLLDHGAARLRRLPAAAGRGELLRRRGADTRTGGGHRSCRREGPRDLAVEDLVDLFSVSYEMAAHRFTNLITHHLDLPCHFVKNDASGIIYKAYENDGVIFPADPPARSRGSGSAASGRDGRSSGPPTGSRPYYQYSDTPSGTYFCVAQVDPRADRGVRDHAGRAVRAFPLVPRPGGDDQDQVGLPGRRVLQPPAGRAGRALGGPGLAVGPGALAHLVGAAGRAFPRRRRRRHLRVPRPARPGVNGHARGVPGYRPDADLLTAA